jgi:hypothetical protein
MGSVRMGERRAVMEIGERSTATRGGKYDDAAA